MATINENFEALKTAKADIKTGMENLGVDLTGVPFTQYGEKLKGIQAGSGSEEVVIEFPEPFDSSRTIYYFQVDKDKVLLSASGTPVFGLWVYTISTKSWKKLYETHYWANFQKVADKCLITSPSSDTTSGILVYDLSTDTVEQKYTYGNKYNVFYVIENKCLISSSSESRGLLLFDTSLNTITSLYNGDRFVGFSLFKGKVLCNRQYNGISLYNPEDNSLVEITDSEGAAINGGNYKELGNKCLISSVSSITKGIWIYYENETTAKKIYSTGDYWNTFQEVEGGCLIGSGNSSGGYGILLYQSSDDTIISPYTSTRGWNGFQALPDGNCLIFSYITSNSGILLYDSIDHTITKKYSNYYSWENFKMIGNDCLISNNLYADSGIVLYKSNDKTITRIYSKGYGYDTFAEDENGCVVSSSDVSKSYLVVYYNKHTQQATTKALKLGV